MELKYRYFFGGEWNPFTKEVAKAYSAVTQERELKDPKHEIPIDELFPKLDSWSDYVVAESKATFWRMERSICEYEDDTVQFIEELWDKALRGHQVGEWLMESEAEDSAKALCFYMASQYCRFNPFDNVVDFRLYFTQGGPLQRNKDDFQPFEL